MSREDCLCDGCLDKGCEVVTKAEYDLKVMELENQMADLSNRLDVANSLVDTLKHVVDYLIENA